MKKNRKEDRDLFLKHMADIYLQNPSLPVFKDTIYHELSKFNVNDGKLNALNNDSLVGVQVKLNSKFRTNENVDTFSNGYFWVIENRANISDNFYDDLSHAVKIYVSVDSSNIYKISELLFNYMIKNNIAMQCKIAKEMRNDALVCRIINKEDASKVIDYVNKLMYKSKVSPNPFIFKCGKASVTLDGSLSYNSTLSKLLKEYFVIKRKSNSLTDVSCDDFGIFVKKQIEMLCSDNKRCYLEKYEISDQEEYKYFIMIANLIVNNINGSLSLDGLYKYQRIGDIDIDACNNKYSPQDENKILFVINALTNYYSIDYIHGVIMEYIKDGNVNLFTRRDNIRSVIYDSFSPLDVKNIISDLGWNAFLAASKATYEKYGYIQMEEAIKDLCSKGLLDKFTNDFDCRSRLGLIIPYPLLKEVIHVKMIEHGNNLNYNSLVNYVFKEINKLDNKKSFGGR